MSSNIAIPTTAGIHVGTTLDLVRRLAMESGTVTHPTTSITTIVNATGETARLASWIINAWRDIQNLKPNWKFMRRSCTFVTVAGQYNYTPVQCGITLNTFGRWDLNSFRSYLTSGGTNGEMFMSKLDYDYYRDSYLYGANRAVRAQPLYVTEFPDTTLGLGPIPPVGYTIKGDYYAAPKDLADDAEVPALPTQCNLMIIVWAALKNYGYFDAAPEAIERAKEEYQKLLYQLMRDQLPPVRMGGPLR